MKKWLIGFVLIVCIAALVKDGNDKRDARERAEIQRAWRQAQQQTYDYSVPDNAYMNPGLMNPGFTNDGGSTTVNINELCPVCHGTNSCSVCSGIGTYSNYGVTTTCTGCNGSGDCWKCGGTGYK